MKNLMRLLFLVMFKKEIKINIYDIVGEYAISHIEVSNRWDGADNIVIKLENAELFRSNKRKGLS